MFFSINDLVLKKCRAEMVSIPSSFASVPCTALHCAQLRCIALHYTVLRCTALCCTALRSRPPPPRPPPSSPTFVSPKAAASTPPTAVRMKPHRSTALDDQCAGHLRPLSGFDGSTSALITHHALLHPRRYLLLCCSAALLLCCSAALLLCCSAALLLCCSAAATASGQQG